MATRKPDAGIAVPPLQETITRSAQAQGRYVGQHGRREHYGDVWLKVAPLPRGQGFEFVNAAPGTAVPQGYIRFIESGIREAMEYGPIAGHRLIDMRVTIFDGSYHEVFSEEYDFKMAAIVAFNKAVFEAHPILLELIMLVEIRIPIQYANAVVASLNERRGKILQEEKAESTQTIQAYMPLVELFDYEVDLLTMTNDQVFYTQKVAHYAQIGRSANN